MKAVQYLGNRKMQICEGKVILPQAGEVRLDVAFCGVCGTDLHIYHGVMDQRLTLPQIIGHEMSGRVVELGEGVTGFKVGDPVVVRPLDSRLESPEDKGQSHICQKLKFLGIDTPGAYQSSWTVPAFTLHKVPENMNLKLAAFVEPVAVACHDVRLGQIKSGEKVVVLGGGPIGLLVALVCLQKGAKVAVSEINDYRISLIKDLGLEAINPKETDLTDWVMKWTDGSGADAVFEVSGSVAGAKVMTDLLCMRGRIIIVAIFAQPPPVDLKKILWREISMIGTRVYEPQDYEESIALIASNQLPLNKLITKTVTLNELPSAFEELDSNPQSMKILVSCQN